MSLFNKAERKKAFLKIAITGVSGSGKTYSALQLAQGLGGKIAMIDTENGSGELYSSLCDYDVAPMEAPFSPEKYIEYIKEAEKAGYNVLIIDSLSHAWAGEGGVLEMVDKAAAASRSGNSFNAWRNVTPEQNKMVNAILQAKMDIIVCMRSKQAYEVAENERGKKMPVKIGLAPVQRDGLEYEFTVMFDIGVEKHIAIASKDRTGLFQGFADVITPDVGLLIRNWSDSGEQVYSDRYCVVTKEKCTVLLKRGRVDVETLADEELVQLLKLPAYELAHPAMEAILEARQKKAEKKAEVIETIMNDNADDDFSAEEIEQAMQKGA